MTTINCSSNCIHQNDGKCTLVNTTITSTSESSDCVFFEEKIQPSNGTKNKTS